MVQSRRLNRGGALWAKFTRGAPRRQRRYIGRQHTQESLSALAKRYGINQKTVAKWKGRTSVAHVPTGPKNPTSTVLTIEEEAVIVAFRQHPLLPLDDCLYALQPTIPSRRPFEGLRGNLCNDTR